MPASTQFGLPARRSTWWPDLAAAGVWLSLLVVTALWIAGRGPQDLGAGSAGALTSGGRVAGLWSADLLLIQVLLMARIPAVEHTFGQDRLARWHRLVGFSSFNLLLVHIGLVTAGYAGVGHRGVLSEAWALITTYPGMLLATASFALITMVAITSMRRARRRLRYESWHLLHLYAYLGVGLAIPHQLWAGADFNASSWAQLYWWGLFAATMGSVVTFRLGLPLWRSAYHRIRVTQVTHEAEGVASIHLRGYRLDRLGAQAGQFFQWRFLDGPGWTRAHPYSLSAAPQRDRLRITVKDLGDDSRRVASLAPGTRVLIEGPYGRLTGATRESRRVTFIGAGIGITPLRALLEELDYGPGEAVLILRSTGTDNVLFRAEFEAIAARRGARIVYLTGHRRHDRSWLPHSGPKVSDANALRHLVPDIAEHDVYICGPDPWMDAARRAVIRCGAPRHRVHLESFGW